MIHKIQSKTRRGVFYEVDLKEMTCTCKQFQYRSSKFLIGDENRTCKHLKEAKKLWPFEMPKAVRIQDSKKNGAIKGPDGKDRYPLKTMEPALIKLFDIMNSFMRNGTILKFSECGSIRRKEQFISDIDMLVVLKDGKQLSAITNYMVNIMGCQRIDGGEKKCSFIMDGFIHVDIKAIPEKSWPFGLLHFTGSKRENMRLRNKALMMGYRLNEYGFKDIKNLNIPPQDFDCKTERDIYNFLKEPYKEPKDRK